MAEPLCARYLLAARPGASVAPQPTTANTLLRLEDLRRQTPLYLPPPFEALTVLPKRAAYAGEPLAIVVGTEWSHIDESLTSFREVPSPPVIAPCGEQVTATTRLSEAATVTQPISTAREGVFDQEVDGTYRSGAHFHWSDETPWAYASYEQGKVRVTLSSQAPGLARKGGGRGAQHTRTERGLTNEIQPGTRDAALWMSAHLAACAALCARHTGSAVRLALQSEQRWITGGRAPSSTVWRSRLTSNGTLYANHAITTVDVGAYPTLNDERTHRIEHAGRAFYSIPHHLHRIVIQRTSSPPFSMMETVGEGAVAFAREVHLNRLAELCGEDPLTWRASHLQADTPS